MNKSFANDFIHGMLLNGGPEGELIPYSRAKITLIELLFFKAMMTRSDFANMQGQEDFNIMLDFMRMCSSGGSGYNEEVLKRTLNMFERNHGLPSGILEIDSFKNLLHNQWYLINETFSLNIPSLEGDYATSLADLITRPQDSKDSANTYLYYTNESLQQLAAGILKVKNNETFMDCCCGMFSSALYNDAANYIGIELDKEIAGIAAMILIMAKKKFNIKHENFLDYKDENVADKILADIPCGTGMPQTENRPYGKNTEAYCIENVVNALKDGGKAVVVCFGSILSKQDSSKKLREALTKDHLQAVVALPPMNIGTKSNTNLIVLQKNCHAKEIKFINASNLEIKNKNRLTLNESDISDIIKSLDGENANCFSASIPVEDILKSDSISWTPNSYVKGDEKSKGRSIEEIDKDLKESYKELKDLFLS
ncbi:N-6 DNA Methylase [Fibrobacter sp. UWB15]|uniref:N-6 DNA methylase n=1 Tax=unclassified Fibrobacter TaxID=2634177 RepID=UPI00091BA455|nr:MULTISPECIES: N-6 DNA methylase [unclassified Fibrobacter]PWJ64117.1 N-6 DNA methylase [Fibrobacter sp. UWB6]SHG21381.1 N-6 DNA Methylase [Fibrobacter sp. UWB8]SMG29055.1 N-6 DNA Methylase [Fibrobacter sp. UWB15]